MSTQGVKSHEGLNQQPLSGEHGSSSSSSLDTQHDLQSNDNKGDDQCAESMLQRSLPLMRAHGSYLEKSPSPQVLQQAVSDAHVVRGVAGRGIELNFVGKTPQRDDQAEDDSSSVHSGGSKTPPSCNADLAVSIQGLHDAPPVQQPIWTTTLSLPVPPSLAGMLNPQADKSSMPAFRFDSLHPTRAFMMGDSGSGSSGSLTYQFPISKLTQDLRLDSLSHAHISSANHSTSQIALSSLSQLDNGIGGPPLGMKQWTNWPQRAEDAQVQGQWSQTNGNGCSDGGSWLPFSFEALLRTGYGGVDQQLHPPPANLHPPAPTWMIPPAANAPRPNPPRIMNSNYDPAYQAMGLPVDPHLRAFLAKYTNNNGR